MFLVEYNYESTMCTTSIPNSILADIILLGNDFVSL
jgi:hypothetical protein